MYSYEERKKAVELLIKYGMAYKTTIRELGYPKDRGTLNSWYKEYEKSGELRKEFKRRPRYSKDEKEKAVAHYMQHGKNISYTVLCLGYPSRGILRSWLEELVPEDRKITRAGGFRINYSNDHKSNIVSEMLLEEKTVTEIAKDHGLSRRSLYNWQRQALSAEVLEKMRKKKARKPEENVSFDEHELQELKKKREALKDEIKQLELEKDILTEVVKVIKKEEGISLHKLRLKNLEKAIIANALRHRYPLHLILRVLQMAKSSYFYYLSVMERGDKYLDMRQQIREIFTKSHSTYGYRRIHIAMRNEGVRISEKVVRRLMKEEGLVVIRKKKAKFNAYKGEAMPSARNLLKRDFHAQKPNEKWVTDITEFAIPAGKIYLSPIIDCFDGMPVSWSIGTNPNAKLANAMLRNAVSSLNNKEQPIIHSDRGGHYRWPGWIKIAEKAGLIRSMSRKACPPDNAACEGFFGLVKNEMFHGRSWTNVSREEFMEILDRYLYWFVNDRIKISLGGLSPVKYREAIGVAF